MTERKSFDLKAIDDEGAGTAIIATLSAVDHDGDTYAKGAFGDQQVKVLAGHSWDGPPLGKGRVFERGDQAVAEFKLNLDSAAGREWHSALKFDMAHGKALQEWSYGFKVLDAVDETRDGKSVRVLKSLDVFEVSPVVKGAGVGTGTVSVKARLTFEEQIDAMISEADDIAKRAGEIADLREGEGRSFSKERLGQIIHAKERLEALVERITKADDPTDRQEAERLMAEFEAIRCGQKRNMKDD